MKRALLIAGNWKMNQTESTARAWAQALGPQSWDPAIVEVAVFPPFTILSVVIHMLKGLPVSVGAQDVSAQKPGAYTGEVAAEFLKDLGCIYSLVGHSERRQYHHEDEILLAAKLRRLLETGVKPLLCIGETLAQREKNETFLVLDRQLEGALAGLTPMQLANLTLAYEPVWAIGTGKVASPEQAQEAHAYIRGKLQTLFGASVASPMRILYGGSVNAANARDLLKQSDIDGALVGGASLKAGEFSNIIAAGMAVMSQVAA
jgi:triosephosphate isomerase